MRDLAAFFSLIFFLAGLGFIGYALFYPTGFSLSGASAIQIQQINGQATYYAAVGIGLLLAAVVCMLSIMGQRVKELVEAQIEAAKQGGE